MGVPQLLGFELIQTASSWEPILGSQTMRDYKGLLKLGYDMAMGLLDPGKGMWWLRLEMPQVVLNWNSV